MKSLNNKTEKGFYESYGIEWASTFRRQAERIVTEYKMKNLLLLCEGVIIPNRVVDFGCGLGNALAHMHQSFPKADLIGIDISSTMIEQAKKDHPQITFIQGPIDDLKELKADLVTFIDVLEHLEDIPHALEAARMCAPYIGIKIPLEQTWLIVILNKLKLKKPQSLAFESEGHLYEFNQEEVKRILHDAGLRIIRDKVDFFKAPRELLFNQHVFERIKKKGGTISRVKYWVFHLLSKMPLPLIYFLLRSYHGPDYFILAKFD